MGSGESNIRRYIIENDWLEAIIQLPNNMFYNTGITTYIWVLSNNKAPQRRGKVQLIDASELYQKLRKNLGAKNCEFAPEHIEQITQTYLAMPKEGISKVFDNADFGYYKVTVERPLRLAAQFTEERIETLRFASRLQDLMERVYEQWGDRVYTELSILQPDILKALEQEDIDLTKKQRDGLFSVKTWETQRELLKMGQTLMSLVGQEVWMDYNEFVATVNAVLKAQKIRLSASEKKQILSAVSWREEEAAKVIKKVHKLKPDALAALLMELDTSEEHLVDFGYWSGEKVGQWIEYETDSELRDTENIPLVCDSAQAAGHSADSAQGTGQDELSPSEVIHAYFLQEVRPHVEDAWIALDKTQIGYEISFNKYFYQHKPLRSLEDVTAEILQLEQETEGLLKKLVSFGAGGIS